MACSSSGNHHHFDILTIEKSESLFKGAPSFLFADLTASQLFYNLGIISWERKKAKVKFEKMFLTKVNSSSILEMILIEQIISLSEIAETDASSATINNTINVQNKNLCKKSLRLSTFYFFAATSQRSLSFAKLFFSLFSITIWNWRNWRICEIQI